MPSSPCLPSMWSSVMSRGWTAQRPTHSRRISRAHRRSERRPQSGAGRFTHRLSPAIPRLHLIVSRVDAFSATPEYTTEFFAADEYEDVADDSASLGNERGCGIVVPSTYLVRHYVAPWCDFAPRRLSTVWHFTSVTNACRANQLQCAQHLLK